MHLRHAVFRAGGLFAVAAMLLALASSLARAQKPTDLKIDLFPGMTPADRPGAWALHDPALRDVPELTGFATGGTETPVPGAALPELSGVPEPREILPTGEKIVPLTLADAVALGLRRNVNIRVAYLERVLQRFNFITDSEFRYRPQVNLDGTATLSHNDESTAAPITSGSASVRSSIIQRIPTGGSFAFIPSYSDSYTRMGDKHSHTTTKSWSLNFTQPLLRGAGVDYDLSFVRQAELSEARNILNLRSTIISETTAVIQSYRSLLQQKWSVEISKNSLEIAKRNLERTRLEVELGRKPEMDLVQMESDLANRELSLEEARIRYIQARLALARQIELDQSVRIDPAEEVRAQHVRINPELARRLVFANKPDYLISRLGLEALELNLLRANRDYLPQLDLNLGIEGSDTWNNDSGSGEDYTAMAGLTLSLPVYGEGARSLRANVLSARSNLHTARLRHKKLEDDIESTLVDSLRDIEMRGKTVKLAERARELAEKKLEVEQLKLKLGRSSTFELASVQEQLFQSRISELGARITYMNALTSFDQFLGTTLATWDIEFVTQRGRAIDQVTQGDGPESLNSGWYGNR